MTTTPGKIETVPAPETTLPRPEQQPWLTPEEARGWRVVARGKRQPRRTAVSVMVDFDLDQSDWLSREAGRTGQHFDDIIKRLVDTERAAST